MTTLSLTHHTLQTHEIGKAILKQNFTYLQEVSNPNYDFVSLRTSAKLRFQSENYSLSSFSDFKRKITNNLFVGTVHIDTVNKPGNIFSAYENGVSYFVYLFILNKTIVVIKLNRSSVETIHRLMSVCREVEIINSGYKSIGRLLPIGLACECLKDHVIVDLL